MNKVSLKQILFHYTLFFVSVCLSVRSVSAQSFLEVTTLNQISVGTGHSSFVQNESQGGYELESGDFVSFDRWYSKQSLDKYVEFATLLSDDLWLHWGMSTGEVGVKYEIEPRLTLGVEKFIPLSDNLGLWAQANVTFGGYLKEKPCMATYSLLEKAHAVNCRLAADILPPEETLQFLWYEPPPTQVDLKVRVTWVF